MPPLAVSDPAPFCGEYNPGCGDRCPSAAANTDPDLMWVCNASPGHDRDHAAYGSHGEGPYATWKDASAYETW